MQEPWRSRWKEVNCCAYGQRRESAATASEAQSIMMNKTIKYLTNRHKIESLVEGKQEGNQ